MMIQHSYTGAALEMIGLAEAAGGQIPPLWPLATSVAVNPYLGQTGQSLPQTAALLARVAGARVTTPRALMREKLDHADVQAAAAHFGLNASELAAALQTDRPAPQPVPTVAELVAQATGVDWPGILADRIGQWASSHFDEGQALWPAHAGGAFASWRAFAKRDLTPSIHGLTGFCERIDTGPDDAAEALCLAAEALGVTPDAAPTLFHRAHTTLGGWSQLARYRQWQDAADTSLRDLLAIRMVWDAALYEQFKDQIGAQWRETVAAHAAPVIPSWDNRADCALQWAMEQAAAQTLATQFDTRPATLGNDTRPALQMAFCIDVRSEVFRRALEAQAPGIETLGFAGFFGLPLKHKAFASDVPEARLPVLLSPQLGSADAAVPAGEQPTRLAARSKRAWGRFKLAAVSSFAFVEAAGPLYANKLLRDTLGFGKAAPAPTAAPTFTDDLPLEAQITTAATILRAMSLTERFARVVVLAGHGAETRNNAHASALHCGACGGHSGEVNARLLAGLLNAPAVRAGLVAHGITVPEDTVFIGALHNTTTDAVTLFAQDAPSPAHAADLSRLTGWLTTAAQTARAERLGKLPGATSDADVLRRAVDWAQVRPELGLAGCSAFVAAPRARTQGLKLDGRAFLHGYDHAHDPDNKVLELILTAPVVVASWISLQYYGSTVSPDVFGGGNKLIHNVTGGVGVVEGNGGTLRGGLPWQSVHDGTKLMHDPLRLCVVIEAPTEAISDVLSRHPQVQALFDNGWLSLYAMDEAGTMRWRYEGGLDWVDAFPAEQGGAMVA